MFTYVRAPEASSIVSEVGVTRAASKFRWTIRPANCDGEQSYFSASPVIETTFANCEIYGISVPSENVGGDLVDAVALPSGPIVAYVADIAGHGLPAGILMAMLRPRPAPSSWTRRCYPNFSTA